ncbi:hypothetical protein ACFX2C_006349 [Malus domestica]
MRSKYPAAWERTSVDPSSRQLNEATKLLLRYALSALPDWGWFAEPVDFITDAIMADTCEYGRRLCPSMGFGSISLLY